MSWLRKRKQITYDEKPYPVTKPYASPLGGRRKRVPSKAIKRYYIPLSVVEATNKLFRKFGALHTEGYAWWAGYINYDDEAQVCTTFYPNITTLPGRVYLDRAILSAMHSRLIGSDQILLVELHTHPPGAGGQNHVDANNAACFYPGFMTIVVPDFAAPKFYDLRDSYVYTYERDGFWRELEREEIAHRFIIEETVIEVKLS